MTDTSDEFRQVRAHEACHAVVAWALQWRLRLIVVVPGARLKGFCDQYPPTDRDPFVFDFEDATIRLAGEMGSFLTRTDGRPEPVIEPPDLTRADLDALPPRDGEFAYAALTDGRDMAAKTDAERAQEIAERAAGPEAEQFLIMAGARARRLVFENVERVFVLADVLAQHPMLVGPAAESVIEGATPSVKP